jgi:hypothetical protein
MCPACLTTVALTAVGATSTGGLAALLARTLRTKRGPKKIPRPPENGAADVPRVESTRGD